MELTVPEKNALRLQERRRLGLPRYTLGEEVANAASHGMGAVFAAAALVFLLVQCEKTPLKISCVNVFGVSMILLYSVSAVYHGLALNRAKVVMRVIDHCTVFLLIAGTYTPVTLVCLGGALGWGMFGVVWGAAVLGIVLNAVSVERFKVFSMICYLSMGWVVALAMPAVIRRLSPLGFWCLLAGGLSYTLGAVLYGLGKKIPYMHTVFHLFVLAGSVLHTVTVWTVTAV